MLMYQMSEQQAQEFLEENSLEDEHPNPFVAIESVLYSQENEVRRSENIDWYFCTNAGCIYYEMYPVNSDVIRCSKCGSKMV